MKQKQKGFTLIELIVVMAIIAILVLIASPKFMGYTEKAKLTKVLNNLKAAETAAELYYMDNDGWPKQPTEYTAAQLNTWVEEFKSISGDTVVLDPLGKYYDVDWNLMKGFMEKPDNNFKYIIQNPVGDVYYANELTASGEQTKFAGDNQVTTEPEPTTEANLAPTAIITMTPNQDITIGTTITWSHLDSIDLDGDIIAAYEWEGKQSTYTTAGTYIIKLRVQDSQGLWSDWVSKTITVEGVLTQALSENNITTATSTYVSYPDYVVKESSGMVSSTKIEDSLGRDISSVTLGSSRYTNIRVYEYGTNSQIYYLGNAGTGNVKINFDRPVKSFYVSVGDANRPELRINGYSVSIGGWGASNEIYSQDTILLTSPVKIQLIATDSIPAGGNIAYYYSLTGKSGTWLPIQKNETISNIDTTSTSVMLKAVGTAGTGGTMPGISNWTLNVVKK